MLERPSQFSVSPGEQTTTRALLDTPGISKITQLLAGSQGLDRPIDHPRIQKSGLVLVGHTVGIVPTRVQILGETEISYLESLDPETRFERSERFCAMSLSLLMVTRGVDPPDELLRAARKHDTPLVVAEHRSSRTISMVHRTLDHLLAPTETRHGVLIDIHGIGTLLQGPSGIGKSECALFLLERGHRLVADDQVVLTRRPSGDVLGAAPALLRHHLEVRGIGVINVRDLFGAPAVRDNKVVQLVVELCPQDNDESFDRLGLDDLSVSILGHSIPHLRIPVQPGRNMAVILEVAARNQLMKQAGHHAAKNFVTRFSLPSQPPIGLGPEGSES